MSKYLELFKGTFDSTVVDKMKPENKPYIGYSLTEGKLAYTVVPKPEQPSLYEAVDLGLPSGLKWANMNVGATSPEDAGLYFRYGDPVGYTIEQLGVDVVFDWDSYNTEVDEATGWEEIKGGGKYPTGFKKYNVNNFDRLEPEDDAAVQNMGSNWRMPTKEDFQELVDNTTQTLIDLDGNEYSQEQAQNVVINENNLKGVKLTGSNGNSIFIPAAGHCNYDRHIAGMYVMNSTVYLGNSCSTLHFDQFDKTIKLFSSYRNYGHTIRGVKA